MPNRRFRGGTGALRQGQRRKTSWVGQADQAFVSVGANASAIIASFPNSGNFEVPVTLVRSRGSLSVVPQSFAADVNVIGAFGAGIVTDEAFAAGAGSIPGPWSNSDWEGWFIWETVNYFYDVTTNDSRMLFPSGTVIDSKAMRKFDTGETMVFMFESQGPALSVSAPVRLLFMLP